MRLLVLLVPFLFAPVLLAQPKPLDIPEPQRATDPSGCAPGEAGGWLDVNAVSAAHSSNGILFDRHVPSNPHPSYRAQPPFRLPKTSSFRPMFSQQIWLGGTVSGETRVVAIQPTGVASYQAFWPGPLDEAGNPPADCADYDHVWSVSRSDLLTYDATGFATPDLAAWPAHLGAPVIDGDGIPDNYDLEAGDRPDLLGDQTLFWVMNDRGNTHAYTGSEPIGIEIRATAWARRSTDPAVHEATFLRYDVTYRGDAPLEDAYVSVFSDPDIGDYHSNFAGVAPERRLVYAYVGETSTSGPYGATPPAVGSAFLATPEDAPLASGMYLVRATGAAPAEPRLAAEVYHTMQGRWRTGQPITVGGYGWEEEGEVTTFTMPNTPPAFWSMECLNGTTSGSTDGCTQSVVPYDARGMISAGPFNLMPGESTSFTVATVYARGSDRLDSVVRLLDATDAVQAAFDAGTLYAPSPDVAPTVANVGVSAVVGQHNVITFYAEWDGVAGAQTYTVQVSPFMDFRSTRMFYSETTALTDSYGAFPDDSDGNLFARVRAETAEGMSAWSEVVPFLFASNEPGSGVEPLAIRAIQPNPLRGAGTVVLNLPAPSEVRVEIVDLLGRAVRPVAEGPREAGAHELALDASGLAAGVYVVRVQAGAEQATARFTVVR